MRFLSILGAASMAAGHGIVQNMTIAGKFYDLYDPYTTPYENPVPELAGWTVQSNSPVQDVTSSAMACNVDSKTGAISATAAAGADVLLHWTAWPSSHKGPTMTYLAACSGDCSDVSDPTTLEWFKINEAGLYSDGTWASDKLIADDNTWTLSLPSSIKAGNYVMRHELLALHSASSVGGAQFYMQCTNLKITGDGTELPTETVKFPGAYSATDPGIEINIYYPTPTSYDIPGPTVWSGASSGSSSSASSASASSTAAASSTEASSSTELAATATSSSATEPTTSLSPATTFVPGTGVFTGTGTASTGFSVPTSAPAVQSADPATTGTDGVVTSSITSISTSTFTSVQTVVMTKTFSETETLTITATSSVAATGSAGLEDASSSKSTLTMTATETITRAQTITETVTSTAKATACTPAGRFRRDLW